MSGRESWDKREVLVRDYCSISHKILQSEILRKLSETLKRINVQIHYHRNFSLFSSNDTKILFDSCYFSLMGWFSYCSPKMRQTGRPAYNQATLQYIQFTWSLVALFDTPEVEGRGEWYIPQAHKTMTIAVAPRWPAKTPSQTFQLIAVYTTPLSLPRKFTSLTSHLGYRNEQIKIKRQNRPCEEYHKRYESCILEVCQLYLLNR